MRPYKNEWYRFERGDPWPDLKWRVEKDPHLTVIDVMGAVLFATLAVVTVFLLMGLE